MLKEILRVCNALNIVGTEYALIGGIAAFLLGAQRTTLDIDILVNIKNYEDVLDLFRGLDELDYNIDIRVIEKAYRLKQNFILPAEGGTIIDFKIAKTDLDFKTLKRRMKVYVEDHVIYLAPLEELIAVKIIEQGALEDIEDAIQLMYIHYDKINWEYLVSLVGKEPLKYIDELLEFLSKKYPIRSFRRTLYYMNRLKRRLRKALRET